MCKAMDTDNSGAIKFDELKAGLTKTGKMRQTVEREMGDTAVDFLITSSNLDFIIDKKHQLQSLADEIKY
ncbi:hypothetical protein RHMOL_Rhmol12G0242800 [Rhododendron molle]|uniref:Uncharacterized protein n=1 Tax=Rhododendron molle TaxID=49168 RepID=A0ACC0LND3_RHOML|nr:hypothetical protein RHMOL_Rhmol12G0242800 [Rhododendron molle]